MLKIALVLLALVAIEPSPVPTPFRPVLGQAVTVDGSEIRAISVACAELPQLFNVDCGSSDMSRFAVAVDVESDDYRVMFMPKGLLGGGVAIYVSNTSFKVTNHYFLY